MKKYLRIYFVKSNKYSPFKKGDKITVYDFDGRDMLAINHLGQIGVIFCSAVSKKRLMKCGYKGQTIKVLINDITSNRKGVRKDDGM